jgi:hypothetical protein
MEVGRETKIWIPASTGERRVVEDISDVNLNADLETSTNQDKWMHASSG